MPSHYDTLNIGVGASFTEIKKAYYSLVKVHHPDKNADGDGEIIRKVNEAYAVLSNTQKRDAYDRKLASSRIHQQHASTNGFKNTPPYGPYYQQRQYEHQPNTPKPNPNYPPNFTSKPQHYNHQQFNSSRDFKGAYYPQGSSGRSTYSYNREEAYPYDRNQTFDGHFDNWQSFGSNSHNYRHQVPKPPMQKSGKDLNGGSQWKYSQEGNDIRQPHNGSSSHEFNKPSFLYNAQPQTNSNHYRDTNNSRVKPKDQATETPRTRTIPESWEKQNYQFNHKTRLFSDINGSNEDTASKSFKNSPSDPQDRSPASSQPPQDNKGLGLKGLKISIGIPKVAPQRLPTTGTRATRISRVPPLYNSKTPIKRAPIINPSGRTSRTEIEDLQDIDYIYEKNEKRSDTSDENDKSFKNKEHEKQKAEKVAQSIKINHEFLEKKQNSSFQGEPQVRTSKTEKPSLFTSSSNMEQETFREGRKIFPSLSEVIKPEVKRPPSFVPNSTNKKQKLNHVPKSSNNFNIKLNKTTFIDNSDSDSDLDVEVGGPPSPKDIEDPNDDSQWIKYKKSVNDFIIDTRKMQAIALQNYANLLESNAKVGLIADDDTDIRSMIRQVSRENIEIRSMERLTSKLYTALEAYEKNRSQRLP